MAPFRSILLLAPLFWVPSAWACDGSTCTSCLAGFNCVWNVASGNGTCQEACGGFPNVDCFYERTFGGGTTEQICEAAATQVEDNEVCFSKDTAESCLQKTGCDWVSGRVESGEERNWCALDIDYTPSVVPCSSDTCTSCLADSGNCVWMKDGTCSNSCENYPNPNCYYSNMFGVRATDSDNAAICEVANNANLTAAQEACMDEVNQDNCFGVSGCAWVPLDDDPTIDGFCTTYLAEDEVNSGVQQYSISFMLVSVTFLVAAWF